MYRHTIEAESVCCNQRTYDVHEGFGDWERLPQVLSDLFMGKSYKTCCGQAAKATESRRKRPQRGHAACCIAGGSRLRHMLQLHSATQIWYTCCLISPTCHTCNAGVDAWKHRFNRRLHITFLRSNSSVIRLQINPDLIKIRARKAQHTKLPLK